MVLAAGVELAKVGQSVGDAMNSRQQIEEDADGGDISRDGKEALERERSDRWVVMLITVAGCLAFKNDAVGFFAGLVWHWGLKTPDLVERTWSGRRSVRLGGDDHGGGLLASRSDVA